MSLLGIKGEIRKMLLEEFVEWKIPNFSALNDSKNIFYKSPSFTFSDARWHFKLYQEVDGHVVVHLCREDARFSISVTSAFGVKNANNVNVMNQRDVVTTTLDKSNDSVYAKFLKKTELLERKSELLPNDTFTVTCSLKKHDVPKKIVELSKMKLVELDTLSENFKNLLTNEKGCDTILQLKDKEFHAHKSILIARSSVFAAMFQYDLTEKQTGIILVSDIDPDSFQEFLQYLYTGKMENPTFRSALHLYTTADKYDVQKLKAFCVECLLRSVTVESVCDIAVLADTHEESELFAVAQEFFTRNMASIFETDGWKSVIRTNVQLAEKLLAKMASEVALWMPCK